MTARARAWAGIAIAIAGLATIIGLHYLRTPTAPEGMGPDPLGAFSGATVWLNAGRGIVDSLHGHPVLVLLWSDTDPASLAALPEAESWRHAYGRYDLRVVGIHEPEYAFAADSSVPARALRHAGVTFPVALDSDYRIGSRFGASDDLPFWILIDAQGHRTFSMTGGAPVSIDRALGAVRALVRHARPDAGLPEDAPPQPTAAAPVRRIFCGTTRAVGPLGRMTPGTTATITAQFQYQESGTAFVPHVVGRWTASAEGVTSARGGASDFLAAQLERGEVGAVIGAESPTRVWVLSDDAWLPDSVRGADVRADTRGGTFIDVREPRLYAIARLDGAHVLKLSPEAPGVTFYELMVQAP